jgi:hypothetical protein
MENEVIDAVRKAAAGNAASAARHRSDEAPEPSVT